MNGVLTFSSLVEALRAGFEPFDRNGDGYLVRTQTARGWAIALVPVQRPSGGRSSSYSPLGR